MTIWRPHSALDHVVTVGIVIPHILKRVGVFEGIGALLRVMFWFAPKATLELVWQRYLTAKKNQSLYIQQTTVVEDFALRLLRLAVLRLPLSVLRAMTEKSAASEIFNWRAYRNGYTAAMYRANIEEKVLEEGPERTEGIWIRHDETKKHDIIVYYIHGGGYAVFSAKFYLEFALAFQGTLLKQGYENPAIFCLEYTLAPDKQYPGQLNEAILGYKEVLAGADKSTKICIGGDSAGGMLALSLLQELALRRLRDESLRHPDVAVLISPWVTLKTHLHRKTNLDYIQPELLHRFADIYTGGVLTNQSPASPGNCQDEEVWQAALPLNGYIVTYDEEEVLADDIKCFIEHQTKRGAELKVLMDQGGVHDWPVLALQICNTYEKRVKGIESISREIRWALGTS